MKDNDKEVRRLDVSVVAPGSASKERLESFDRARSGLIAGEHESVLGYTRRARSVVSLDKVVFD